MKNKNLYFVLIAFAILFGTNFVSGFGVGTLYSDGFPLKLKAGESREVGFFVRNNVEGDSDVIVKAELVKGREIARLIDLNTEYEVLFGDEVVVSVLVEIPEDAIPGTKHVVGAVFSPVPVGGEGTVQLVTNIGKNFPVVIQGKESPSLLSRSLTIEEDDEEIFGGLAPEKSGEDRGLFWVVISILIFLVVIVSVVLVIVLVIFFRKKNNLDLQRAGWVQQSGSSGMGGQVMNNFGGGGLGGMQS